MFKKILAIVAMLIVSATAATAGPNAAPKLIPLFNNHNHNPIPTYIYTDYRTDHHPGINQIVPWTPVYVVGVLLRDTGIMYPLVEDGQSVNYCRTPEIHQASEILHPSSCRPIFIELYTVPIPKGHPVYRTPFDIVQELQISNP